MWQVMKLKRAHTSSWQLKLVSVDTESMRYLTPPKVTKHRRWHRASVGIEAFTNVLEPIVGAFLLVAHGAPFQGSQRKSPLRTPNTQSPAWNDAY